MREFRAKNKAIVLLKRAGMAMEEIARAFGEQGKPDDKRHIYRIWKRDKDKY
jgi:hypothetical protein